MPSFALPSVPESVSIAVVAAEAAVAEVGLSEEVLGRASLAVAEAVANAIEHGNAGDVGRRVRVEIMTEPEALAVSVCDEGEGIRNARVQAAELPGDPLQTHGRGLFLIRVLTDQCEVIEGCLHLRFHERNG